jgi:hypothetical protein
MAQLGSTVNTGLGSNLSSTVPNDNMPTIFGTGMYQTPDFTINGASFNSPVDSSSQFSGQLNNYLGSTNQPVVATQAGGPAAQANQMNVANTFGQIANGQGPNPALAAAQQQGAANLQSSESILGSARGAGNPAAAQLAARGAQATGANQVAQNAVAGETQQQLGALGQQANIYGQVAGQQQGLNTFNTGQANTIAQGNQANTTATNTNLMNTLSAQDLAQLNANISAQQLGVQQQLGIGQIGQQAYASSANNGARLTGSIFSGVSGGIGAFI